MYRFFSATIVTIIILVILVFLGTDYNLSQNVRKIGAALYTEQEQKSINAAKKGRKLPITIDDLDSVPWRADAPKPHFALHLGQRKLLLSEILFLAEHAQNGDTVVYAGAAPGLHIPFLQELFAEKNITYELYDPRAFGIAETPQIKLHQEFFTDEVAEEYSGRDDVLFISDIRTVEEGRPVLEEDVEKNNKQQNEWVLAMNPRAAVLKFRPHYSGPPGTLSRLNGKIYLQPWAPRGSSETRLITTRPFKYVNYERSDYEGKMFYLNVALREFGHFKHNIPTSEVSGLDHCFDCSLEIYIWGRYLGALTKPSARTDQVGRITERIAVLMNRTSQVIHRSLKKPPHPRKNYK